MDKKKAKKPTDQNCFHGTNKYTNGSYGYLSVFLCLFYFSLTGDPVEKNSGKAVGYAYLDVVRDYKNMTQSSKQLSSIDF